MATTTLDNALDAIVTGLATVSGLGSTTVAKYDHMVLQKATAAMIAPSFSGQQERATTASWQQTHMVDITLSVRQVTTIAAMLASMAVLVPLVLAWFRSNDALGKTDVSCSLESITWEAGDDVLEDNGVVRKEVVVTVPVMIWM